MNRWPVTALLVAALAAGLAQAKSPAPSPPKSEPVTVTLAQSDSQVDLVVGQELRVRLEGNPSTGYAWVIARSKSGTKSRVVKPRGESRYEAPIAPADGKPLVGAPGVEVWTFVAAKRGSHTLKLEYRRGWEKDVAPAKTASFKITVREAPTK